MFSFNSQFSEYGESFISSVGSIDQDSDFANMLLRIPCAYIHEDTAAVAKQVA